MRAGLCEVDVLISEAFVTGWLVVACILYQPGCGCFCAQGTARPTA